MTRSISMAPLASHYVVSGCHVSAVSKEEMANRTSFGTALTLA